MKFGTAASLALAILCILVRESRAQDCKLDAVCYALDQSGSVDDNEYEEVKNFTITSSRLFPKGSLTSYSAIAFSSSSMTIQMPTQDLEGEFVPSISSKRIFKGGTNIYSGLEACYEILKSTPSPGKVLVLVTDGHGHNGTSPVDKIKAEQISIVSIGVGSGVNQQFLLQLASDAGFYLPASAFNMLPTFAQRVASAVCAAVSTPTATATSTPSATTSTTPSTSISESATPSATSSTTPSASASLSASPTASTSMTPSSSVSMTPSASASSSGSSIPSASSSRAPLLDSLKEPLVPEETAMPLESLEPSPEEITPSNPVETMEVLPTPTPSSFLTSSPQTSPLYTLNQGQTCANSCLNAIEECRSMIQSACS